jgi:hypothetical protein
MINGPSSPRTPVLDDAWIESRRAYLVKEIVSSAPRHRSRRVLVGASGALAASAALAVGVFGLGASPAFAGWTAQPTTTSPDVLAPAEAACAQEASSIAANNPEYGSLAPVALTDSRGPYTLIVYGQSPNPSICVSGNGFTALSESTGSGVGATVSSITGSSGQSGQGVATHEGSSHASVAVTPTPGQAAIENTFTMSGNGAPFSVVEGVVGTDVGQVDLVLSDGTSVDATVGNGTFVAWWPGDASVTSTQVTSAASS